MLSSSGRQRRKVAQMHGQLGGDFVVSEVVEKLQHRPKRSAEDQHRALTSQSVGPALAGVAAVVLVGARPDVLEAFVASHGADRARLAFDDCPLQALRGAAIGEVAVSVEEALAAVDAAETIPARPAP